MLKKIVSLTLIYTVFLLTGFSSQVFAQAKTIAPKNEKAVTAKTETNEDVKKVFQKELSKSKLEKSEASVNFDKIEKDQYKQVQKGNGLSQKEKVGIVLIIIAAVVGAILLWKYIKVPKCSQVDCDPDFDENCICDDGT